MLAREVSLSIIAFLQSRLQTSLANLHPQAAPEINLRNSSLESEFSADASVPVSGQIVNLHRLNRGVPLANKGWVIAE